KIGVIIDNGPPGTPDSVWARDPTVLQEPDGSFKMWYNGFDGGRSIILLATSSDGFSWTKQGAVLDYGGNAGAPFVLREGSTYHMWFQAGSIFHAVSQDGRSWTVDGIALAPNYPNWDGLTVGTPWVVQYGGQYQMYFMGSDGGTDRIGLATSSTYWNFTRVSSNPVFEPGGTWDSFKVRNPAVKPGNPWIMYYAGLGNSFFQVGIATSPDGVGWTRGSTPILAPDPSPSWHSQGTVGAKFIDGAHGRRLYYTGSDASSVKIGLAGKASVKVQTREGFAPAHDLAPGRVDQFRPSHGPPSGSDPLSTCFSGFLDGNKCRGFHRRNSPGGSRHRARRFATPPERNWICQTGNRARQWAPRFARFGLGEKSFSPLGVRRFVQDVVLRVGRIPIEHLARHIAGRRGLEQAGCGLADFHDRVRTLRPSGSLDLPHVV